MNGISGELALTFRVREPADVEKIMAFYREFEAGPVIEHVRHERRHTIAKGTQEEIIKLLKVTFPREGFMMKEAAAVVEEKLHVGRRSTQHAVSKAKRQGVLLIHGRTYVWVEAVKKLVEAKLQKQPQAPGTDQPIAQAPAVG